MNVVIRGIYRKLPINVRKLINRLRKKRIVIVDGPLQYAKNGLYTKHNADFYNKEGDFIAAFEESCRITSYKNPAPWRAYVCCWAIKRAAHELDGDLVECGVWRGTTSMAGLLYSNWKANKNKKTFWLVDSWEGLNEELLLDGESDKYSKNKEAVYKGIFPNVNNTFSNIDGVKLIKGFVPDALKDIDSEKVSYLHIDMNSAYPELETIKYFWDRLVPGAVVVIDDYGFLYHEIQKKVFDEFCTEVGTEVLTLPTGQGVIVKS